MAHINRRKYGFQGSESSKRSEIVEGHISQNKKHESTKIVGPNRFWPILAFILLLPFKILWFILKKLFNLWKKRPKISKKNKKLLWAKSGWIILTGVVLVFLIGTIMVAWASRDLPDPNKLTDRKVAQSTKIYDRTGEHLLYEVFSDEKRTMVTLEQIPKYLVNGVIATEDTKFYEHKGIEPLGWIRAVVYAVIKGQKIGGTSTITQQLVKNAILTNERSYLRKIKEIILSLRLEQKYTKDQILQIYFNEIPYGSTNYGVESAAESYFGKHVSELNLQECATLAGLPQSPSRFLNDAIALKNRRDFVLERMFLEGYISRANADKAQAEPITLQKNYGNIKAPHFVLYVKEQLINQFGEQVVDTGGLKVFTTLDWDKQLIAEEVISSSTKMLADSKANNAALVALDPKTGQILSMVGSRDFYNKEINGQFNVVTLGKRQPGSSFKPIIYAAAFEKGYTPDTILWDVQRNFAAAGTPYQPHDYDNKERGSVTIRQALQGSLNLPAVEALYLVGAKKGVDFAGRMGYTTLSEGEFGLTLVLGGGEVKLLEHTNAYAVFANNGVRNDTVSVLKVEDPTGDILYQWKPNDGEHVLDQKITDTMSNVLSDDAARAYVFGAGSVLTLKDRPVAAKTGTTNDYKDAWTVGYTPSLVAGVWVGNTDNKEMKHGDGGSKLAAPIWNKFMSGALKNSPVEQFNPLPPNDAEKPILRGAVGGSITLNIDQLTNKIAVTSTPPGNIVKRVYIPAHSILYYVNKDDPRGPAPSDPSADPQYSIWENAITDWVKRQKQANPNWQVIFEDPPTEYDLPFSPDVNGPSLQIVSPAPNSMLTNREIIANINVSGQSGLLKVTYQIDNKYVGVVKQPPFGLDYYASGLTDGAHTLVVSAEYGTGAILQQSVAFDLQAGEEKPSVYWAENNQSIATVNFPQTLFLNFYQLDKIVEASVYQQSDNGGKVLLGAIDLKNVYNNQLSFKWNEAPAAGNYNLIVEVKLKDGSVREMSGMKVVVQP